MDGHNRLLIVVGASVVGATVLSIAIYRRFFSTRRNVTAKDNRQSEEDNRVTEESHEVSPPVGFKTNGDRGSVQDELVETVMSKAVSDQTAENAADEEMIVPTMSGRVDCAARVHSADNSLPPKYDRSKGENDAENQEVSPPVDFKTNGDGDSVHDELVETVMNEAVSDHAAKNVADAEMIVPTISGRIDCAAPMYSGDNSLPRKHDQSEGDNCVPEENHEISPPVDFKTNSDRGSVQDDLVETVMKEVVSDQMAENAADEEMIVPSISDRVDCAAPMHYGDNSLPSKHNHLDEFQKRESKDPKINMDFEVSPPIDFKSASNIERCDDERLLTHVSKTDNVCGETVEGTIVPSTTSDIAFVAVPPDNFDFDSGLEVIPIPSYASQDTEKVELSGTDEDFSGPPDINPKSDERPTAFTPKSSLVEEANAEISHVEQVSNTLSTTDIVGAGQKVDETTGSFDNSQISNDSSINGCSSVTDSGVGSTVVGGDKLPLETHSDEDSVQTGKPVNGHGMDLTEQPGISDKGASGIMGDVNGGEVESTPSDVSEHQKSVQQPEPTNSGESLEPSPTARVVKEFFMPEAICGRFIGKGGRNILALKRQTNTSIKLSHDLVMVGNKSCVVEGAAMNVERALRLIQKQYPEVDVSGAVPPATLTLSTNLMQLSLPVGVMLDAVISQIVSAGHVFVQQPTLPSFRSWQRLDVTMNSSYGDGSTTPTLPSGVEDGILCVAPMQGWWHRAQLMAFNEDGTTCEVKLMDVGGYATVDTASIRQIRADFLSLPFQAIECYLANITPLKGEDYFRSEATDALAALTRNQVVQCQSIAVEEHNNIPYIHIISQDNRKAVVVNKELANKGLVDWYEMVA